jgi:hypothetical protein
MPTGIERRARREHEAQRNFVRIPHGAAPPTRNRSSIQLEFHGVSFRFVGGRRRAVYHQLDGGLELADCCRCIVHFSEGIWGWPDFKPLRIERVSSCPIDEHKMAARRPFEEECA